MCGTGLPGICVASVHVRGTGVPVGMRLDNEPPVPRVPGNCVQDLLCLFALWSLARARTDTHDTHLGK